MIVKLLKIFLFIISFSISAQINNDLNQNKYFELEINLLKIKKPGIAFIAIYNNSLDFNSGDNGPRVSPGFRWKHNGSVGPWAVHSYIRTNSGNGNFNSSVNFSTIIEVVSGSPIQIEHKKFSGSGNVSSPASGVEFIVKRRL